MISQQSHKSRATKGVTAVLGFMLVFSFMILAAAQYQATVIPIQEEDTEIQHNRKVQTQMSGLQSAIRGSANSNELRTQPVKLGTYYEDKMIFGIIPAIHPPDPTGHLIYKPAPQASIVIEGAQGQRGAEEYWSGGERVYSNTNTGWVIYKPNYNHYQIAPKTVYENGIIYNEYPSGEIVFQSDQNFIHGRNITITSLAGAVNVQSSGTRSIEAHPVSAPRTRIAIESPDSRPMRIRLPTRLSEQNWTNLLQKQINRGYVNDVESVSGKQAVDIYLQADTTYTLGMARVFVSTQQSNTTIPSASKEYIAWDEDQVIIREQSKAKISAQVRDKYNNPIPGVNVEAIARDSNGQCIGNFSSASGPGPECSTNVDQPGLQTSANEGRVTFIYEAPQVTEDTQIDITLKFEN